MRYLVLLLLLSPLAAHAQSTADTGASVRTLCGNGSGWVACTGGSGGGTVTTQLQSGTFNSDSATIGTTAVTVVAALTAGQTRKALFIEVLTSGATVYCNDLGTATAGQDSLLLSQYFNWAALGYLPNTAISCISSAASTVLTIREMH